MVFPFLIPIAFMGAKAAVGYVDKKMDEREAKKARERRAIEEAEQAQVDAVLRIQKLEDDLREAERVRKRDEKLRIEREERERLQRLEDARIAEEKRKAELERLAKEAAIMEARRVQAEKDAATARARQKAAENELREKERQRAEIKAKLDAAIAAQKAAEDALLAGIPTDVRPERHHLHAFRKKYGYQHNKLHVAVVGESGMGKSSFINAVRGLKRGDPGFASVSLNECTMDVTRYEDPRHLDLVWYDVPGANTATIKGWTYFMDQGLFAFDVLILVFCDRFTEMVGTLLKNAKTCNKPVFLVRTKADQLIGNLKYNADGSTSEDVLKNQVVAMSRDTVRKNMDMISMPTDFEFYLVSRDALIAYANEGRVSSSTIHEKKLLDDIYAHKKKAK